MTGNRTDPTNAWPNYLVFYTGSATASASFVNGGSYTTSVITHACFFFPTPVSAGAWAALYIAGSPAIATPPVASGQNFWMWEGEVPVRYSPSAPTLVFASSVTPLANLGVFLSGRVVPLDNSAALT